MVKSKLIQLFRRWDVDDVEMRHVEDFLKFVKEEIKENGGELSKEIVEEGIHNLIFELWKKEEEMDKDEFAKIIEGAYVICCQGIVV